LFESCHTIDCHVTYLHESFYTFSHYLRTPPPLSRERGGAKDTQRSFTDTQGLLRGYTRLLCEYIAFFMRTQTTFCVYRALLRIYLHVCADEEGFYEDIEGSFADMYGSDADI